MATLPQVVPPPGAISGNAPSPDGVPQSSEGTQKVLTIVRTARELAKDFPGAESEIRQILDLAQKLNMKVMQKSKPQETLAPPV